MKTEEHYSWMILWCGKWKRTRYTCSEESIRKEHPEAKKIEGTMVIRQIAETDDELWRRVGSTGVKNYGASLNSEPPQDKGAGPVS